MSSKSAKTQRSFRHARIRAKVSGTANRPRMSVYRSLNNIYVQVIDDQVGVTIASASSLEKELKDGTDDLGKTDISRLVGQAVARRAKELGVDTVVFDRGGYKFHGRVKAVAEAAREEGLKF